MTEHEIELFILSHNWKFAKTMPTIPHWYVVREQCRNDLEFCRFVMHIRKYGEVRPWHKYRHTYLDIGEYSYWTMGSPIDETIIINRAYLYKPTF